MLKLAAFVDPDKAIDIPCEIVDLICWNLDPFSLGRTACVSKVWREAASVDIIWRQFVRHWLHRCPLAPAKLTATANSFLASLLQVSSLYSDGILSFCSSILAWQCLLPWQVACGTRRQHPAPLTSFRLSARRCRAQLQYGVLEVKSAHEHNVQELPGGSPVGMGV